MPITSDRHHYSSLSRSMGHVLYVLHQRLRRANLPFLVAFFSSLFMLLRALSGAGYVDPHLHSQPIPPPALNYSHDVGSKSGLGSGSLNPHGYGGFAGHWARFKEAVLSCPEDVTPSKNDVVGSVGIVGFEDGMDLDSEGEGHGDSVMNRERKDSPTPAPTPKAITIPIPTSSRRVGVGCLKERLNGMIGLSRQRERLRRPDVDDDDDDDSGPAINIVKVEQEDKAFGVSLDGIGINIRGGGGGSRKVDSETGEE